MRNPLRRVTGYCLLLSGLLISVPAVAEDSGWRAPLEVPGATTVSVDEASALYEAGVAFVDVRNPRLYARRHVPGAHHLDLKDNFTRDALNALLRKDEPLLIYCSGVKCSRSSRACARALAWGYEKVYYFRGGIVAWRKAGLPLESDN